MKPIRFFFMSVLCCLLGTATQQKAAAQANGVTVDVNLGAEMVSPADGTTLHSSTVTFDWTPLEYVSQYWLQLGTTAGGKDLFNSSLGQKTSITISSLPINGRPIYATLWSYAYGDWYNFSYAYPTAAAAQPARISSPTDGSTLPGSTVKFTWAPVTQGVAYHLWVGNAQDADDLVNQAAGQSTSWTITGLPLDGRAIYVKLWTWTGSTWESTSSRYTAASTGSNAANNSSAKQVLRFEGTDDFALVPIKASTDSYTVSIWFKTSNPDCGLFMATTTSLGDYDRNIYLRNGNLCARLWSEETIATVNQNYADGNWHQVTHVFGGSVGGQKIYADGQLRASGNMTKSGFTWQTHIRIGIGYGANDPFFQGDVFDVRLWDIALSASDIAAQVQAVPNLSHPNLIGYWTFNEPTASQQILNSAPRGSSSIGTLGADAQVAQDDPQRVPYQATSSGNTTVAAGLVFNYYEASLSTAAPATFAALKPVATGVTANFDLSQAKRSTDIGLVFAGFVRVDTAGSYTFYTDSDDGSQLFIDDALVVDNDGYHGVTEKSGTKQLSAGYHRIELTFFQGGGPDALQVDWAGPSIARAIIPSDHLFHAVNSN